MSQDFEAVIGLEVHVQLATATKIFCGCPARLGEGVSVADVETNSLVCPICTGHPGTLPVLNRKVIEFAIQAGLALNCEINPKSVLARKNYFYPDLPKGYQISQYEQPLCLKGFLEIFPEGSGASSQGSGKKIGITRIHIEEDAGKSVHFSGFSLVNLNRAGVPLIEVVSEPEISSPAEAGAYLRSLHAIVTFLGISDGNMEEGNFRCDANVSVRRPGEPLGTRVEIKNVNSFKFIEKAIEYEILRQSEVIRSGKKVVQETRSFDSFKNVTLSMRSKEEAEDYRYFPDPDLIPLYVDSDWIRELESKMSELPQRRRHRYETDDQLSPYDSGILVTSREMADFYEETIKLLKAKLMETGFSFLAPDMVSAGRVASKAVANWLGGEILRLLNENKTTLKKSRLTPKHLSELVCLVLKQDISSTGAKQALMKVWETGQQVSEVIQQEGLSQISDESVLAPVIHKIIAAFPKQVEEYRSGKEKLIGFFVGQVMKETQGKANPALVGEWVRKALKTERT